MNLLDFIFYQYFFNFFLSSFIFINHWHFLICFFFSNLIYSLQRNVFIYYGSVILLEFFKSHSFIFPSPFLLISSYYLFAILSFKAPCSFSLYLDVFPFWTFLSVFCSYLHSLSLAINNVFTSTITFLIVCFLSQRLFSMLSAANRFSYHVFYAHSPFHPFFYVLFLNIFLSTLYFFFVLVLFSFSLSFYSPLSIFFLSLTLYIYCRSFQG